MNFIILENLVLFIILNTYIYNLLLTIITINYHVMQITYTSFNFYYVKKIYDLISKK